MREGKRIRAGHLDVRVVASPLAHSPGAHTRVGLIVPRYRHSAVARNQLKRRLRELTRLRLLPSRLPYDVVVRTRPEAYDADFQQLTSDVDRVIAQLVRWSQSPAPLDTAPPATPSAS